MVKRNLTPGYYFAKPETILHGICSHAHLLLELEKELRNSLPKSLSEHLVVANLRDGQLVIGADSPVWAERLRYLVPQILSWFSDKRQDLAVQKIKLRTFPQAVQKSAPKIQKEMSEENTELLEQTAHAVVDPELMKAILRLAAHTKKP